MLFFEKQTAAAMEDTKMEIHDLPSKTRASQDGRAPQDAIYAKGRRWVKGNLGECPTTQCSAQLL